MNKIKTFYKNEFLSEQKCYFVFAIFNVNLSIINLLKASIEDDFGLKVSSIKSNLNVTLLYLEINFKNYLENKENLNDFFFKEDFKFYLVSIFYKNNHIQPFFFENEFLNILEFTDVLDEIMYFNFISVLHNQIENYKFFFFVYNIIMLNKTIFKFNVNNTPGGV